MKYNINLIKEKFDKGENLEYLFFWGHQTLKGKIDKSCLSQWYPSVFDDDGVKFNTAEHFMMSEKANLFGDVDTWEEIVESKDPKEAKGLGRKIKNFDSWVWDLEKYDIVKKGNILKFGQHKKLKDFLLSTGDQILVEASPYDTIWGIGMLGSDPDAIDPYKWKGENLLGFALMEVRDILKQNPED